MCGVAHQNGGYFILNEQEDKGGSQFLEQAAGVKIQFTQTWWALGVVEHTVQSNPEQLANSQLS